MSATADGVIALVELAEAVAQRRERAGRKRHRRDRGVGQPAGDLGAALGDALSRN